MSASPDQTLGVTQIADLAGVRSSAVSNWRRRHNDFPSPVGTAPGGGDLFRLSEVEQWLRAHNRSVRAMDTGRKLWLALDGARGVLSTDDASALALACLALADRATDGERALVLAAPLGDALGSVAAIARRVADADPTYLPIADLRDDDGSLAVAHVVRVAFEIATRAERAQAFESVLTARRRMSPIGGHHETDPSLAALMVGLAEPLGGVVVDPASGTGGLLMEAAAVSGDELTLIGEDTNRAACAITSERLRLRGVEARVHHADSFGATELRDGAADVVVLDPPLNQRLDPTQIEADDPRWIAGVPRRTADFAWLQHAVWLMRPQSGRAVVVTTAGPGFRTGREARIRAEMLRRGLIEGVIALPPGSAGRATQVALTVWLLRRPAGGADDTTVLVVDASSLGGPRDDVLSAPLRERVVDTVRSFRSGSFEPVQGFSAEVPLVELLGSDSVVSPPKWVGAEGDDTLGADLAAASGATVSARERLDASALSPISLVPLAERRSPRTVGDLIEGGHLELMRGSRIDEADLADRGVPLLGMEETRRRDSGQRFIQPDHVPSKAALTREGDVILVPGSGSLRAIIDPDGGKLLLAPLSAVRSREGWMPAPLLAALLTSERNTRSASAGASIPRVRLLDLEVPHLTEDEARAATAMLLSLQQQQAAVDALASALASLKAALIAGIGSGSLAPPAEEQSE